MLYHKLLTRIEACAALQVRNGVEESYSLPLLLELCAQWFA